MRACRANGGYFGDDNLSTITLGVERFCAMPPEGSSSKTNNPIRFMKTV